jgi:hypothetical protein
MPAPPYPGIICNAMGSIWPLPQRAHESHLLDQVLAGCSGRDQGEVGLLPSRSLLLDCNLPHLPHPLAPMLEHELVVQPLRRGIHDGLCTDVLVALVALGF